MAQSRFRAVPVASLVLEEMSDNRPNPELARKTEAATLGDVAAFMSHSWSDDATSKLARLQEYAAEHDRAHGTPCRIWLDKFCIDQEQIDASLACLPVFLSGCNQLLVLAGTTYTERLWCTVEMFVYVRMGGRFESMVVRLLSEGTDLQRKLARFDAGKARCYLDDDRQKLLAVIEGAFGTFAPFNHLVRSIFKKQLEKEGK